MELINYNSPVVDYSNLQTYQEEAWFLVFIAVLLGLGATVVLGAAVWCLVQGKGSFTGGTKWEDGLHISIECK